MTAPLRVGLLGDMSSGPPGPVDLEPWLRRAVEDLHAAGALQNPVEFVHAFGLGLPQGEAGNVERAFAELADAGALLVVGPAIGDNALIATPLAEQFGLPTINWAGSEYARNRYMFQLQVGSHQDEPLLLADYLARRGARELAVIYDASPIGEGYVQALGYAARTRGLEMAASAIDPLAENADDALAQVLDSATSACLYLGLGHCIAAVNTALDAAGWCGERITTSAGIRGYHPQFAAHLEGWVYVDLWSEGNRTLAALRQRFELDISASFAAAKGWDLGRLVAHALASAPEATREGVLRGLELTKWLPAAEGEEGTLLGFGAWDRGALHGRYLVPRRWVDGRSVAVAMD
ncbi:amino acid ABC transporter substrate-binding protein [Mangrovimicrobium sediminis]|uniref:Amino acid ABC transporter substrate-binding protein n=1 Tax=Mangrovimicrobium sediminis TaxID=2562682 RepID=A0A4Z0M6U6_9GAMM|nr:ABC transporter substrate-binding protein [Haliea sp. SAOS-164]TGD75241.1 amino acid ABC transporter substrate-binding protein [Haliea sp. SAOS-164]